MTDIYTLPDLPYDPSALAKLEEIRENRDFSAISMLEKNLAFNVSGHGLHRLLDQPQP